MFNQAIKFFEQGDKVKENQVIAEVETDKAVVEIPSPKEVEINKPIIGPIVEQAVELTKVEKTKLSLSAVLSYLRGAPQGAR